MRLQSVLLLILVSSGCLGGLGPSAPPGSDATGPDDLARPTDR